MSAPQTTTQTISRPILKSFLYTLLILVFPVLAGVIAVVAALDETTTLLVQAAFFALAALAACLIIRFGALSFSRVGMRMPAANSAPKLWWYLPLIAIEIVPFVAGFRTALTLPYLLVLAIFVICVGITEELYFRGLILSTLRQRGIGVAIVLSSLLFGVGHLANLAGGAALDVTLMQITSAFLAGLVLAGIVTHTGSLLIPILWHIAHNFISMITAEADETLQLTILGVQCLILVIYGYHLWRTLQTRAPSTPQPSATP